MSECDPCSDGCRLPLAVDRQIDRLSDAFERAWKAGLSPRIEDYLEHLPAAARTQLFDELLAVELDLLEQGGQHPDAHAYQQRFPGREAAIERLTRRQLKDAPIGGPPSTAGRELTHGDRTQSHDPTNIGRFTIQRSLGEGGFGVVYLAHDPKSERLVALKVPRSGLFAAEQQRESFLQEARAATALRHPGLVPVHEIQEEGQRIYIVQEYIEGQNLAQWAVAGVRSWHDIARCMAEIATAIVYVHQRGFCHRDLKPSNILVDKAGHAHVADFGLAIHEDTQWLLKGTVAGTPSYMSPEQCRGETHWIDGRSDLWALGVILYELLTGRRPFAGGANSELYAEIQHRDPQPPRMRNPRAPKELERICLKCLAKRRTQRYASASDLLEDLLAYREGSSATAAVEVSSALEATPNSDGERPARVVPKGLRSFDKEDQDFFLDLLPGARDREGLPESVRFWKTRLEEADAAATFAVGVMYGPSGCGKSSLLKAGLLPRLAGHVLPILVEATRECTELRLLEALRKRVPALAALSTLPEAMAQLREGHVHPQQKVLLVLDQFEQWLHVTTDMDGSPLVRALRQCDGARVQCLILVRDDFWLSSTRFMQALEIPLREGVNSALVDLLDPSHARTVLRAFGSAYGRLPEGRLAIDQQRFLDQAVEEMAHDGKVVCVQLALLAEMMKSRPWSPASLQELGGASGVGVAFLDDTFDGKSAAPSHRLHARAARTVLKALLPDAGTDIRGQMQPTRQLCESSGYATRPDDFRDLLHTLDDELRLITPTERVEIDFEVTDSSSATNNQQYYQLTHDYLVPSLREWLTRKQKETHRGRAELRLAERTALWHVKPEHRYLPSVQEFLQILALVRSEKRSTSDRQMMRAATRYYGLRGAFALVVMLLTLISLQRFAAVEQRKSVDQALAALQASHGPAVPLILDNLRRLPRSQVKGALSQVLEDASDVESLPLTYALADPDFGEVDRSFLIGAIGTAPAEECDNIATALGHDRERSLHDLHDASVRATSKQDWALKTRLATVALYLNDTTIAAEMLRTAPRQTTTSSSRGAQPGWGDPPLNPNWPPADEAARTAIAAAHGMLEDRFAFCLDMPWQTFLGVQETLRPSRYRPTRVRPFTHNNERFVAAVWTRDDRQFQFNWDLTPDDPLFAGASAGRDGLIPVDVACYPGETDPALVCVLWSELTQAGEFRFVRADMTRSDWEQMHVFTAFDNLLPRPITLHVVRARDGTRRYSGIWSSMDFANSPTVALPKSSLQTDTAIYNDISFLGRSKPTHPLDILRQHLAALSRLQLDNRDTPAAMLARAKGHYYLDQPRDALADLSLLATQTPPGAEALLYRALCEAQLGHAAEAAASIVELAEGAPNRDRDRYALALTSAWLGNLGGAEYNFKELLRHTDDAMATYYAAGVAAQFIRIVKDATPAQATEWRRQATELLHRCRELGCTSFECIDSEPRFAPLFDEPEFQALVNECVTGTAYSIVEAEGMHFSCWTDAELPLEEQQQTARQRAATGCRPVAVAVAPDLGLPRSTMVWHRPNSAFPPPPEWDPVQRTMFIEHFPSWSGSVEGFADVVSARADASFRSGMSLAIGTLINPSLKARAIWSKLLSDWHSSQPDSGTHSSTEWALRSWGLPLPDVLQRSPGNERDWQLTKTGLTMIRVPAGEAKGASDQTGWPWGRLIRVPNAIWISSQEITVSQFLAFMNDRDYQFEKPDNEFLNGTSNPDHPMTYVNWYDVVMFCNWLSRREGYSPCYVKVGKQRFRVRDDGPTMEYDVWKCMPDVNGYRLPKTDEWEFAGRAGATTAFHFGDVERLAYRYEVISKNSNDAPDVVGSKLCNAWGLFDVHGNAMEWCQDEQDDYIAVAEGGNYNAPALFAKFAYRPVNGQDPPDNRTRFTGFRVVATLPPRPVDRVESRRE